MAKTALITGVTGQDGSYLASTSELYGLVQQIPQTESTPFYPRSPYRAAVVRHLNAGRRTAQITRRVAAHGWIADINLADGIRSTYDWFLPKGVDYRGR